MDTIILGQQFGSLRVLLKDTRIDKNGRSYWVCECKCGHISSKRQDSLLRNTKCVVCKNVKSLIGMRFDKLIAVEMHYTKNNPIYFTCLCDCGNITKVRSSHLTAGTVSSCGCKKNKTLTGYKFNAFTVTGLAPQKRGGLRYWECRCDCGNVRQISTGEITSTLARKSCGCLKQNKPDIMDPGYLLKLTRTLRKSVFANNWRLACLKAAKNVCQITQQNNSCEVHHINSLKYLIEKHKVTYDNYKQYLPILFDVSNGFVMSKQLHVEFHKKFGYYTTKEQLDQFILENS